MWNELYNSDNEPTMGNIKTYVNTDLWGKLCNYLETQYKVSPNIEYSKCSAQPGWNVKYKKSNKSLCTLYPMKNYFIVLVVIGNKEQDEAEIIMKSCTTYIQELYKKTTFSCGGRWLMIEVRDEMILEDVNKLVRLRVG